MQLEESNDPPRTSASFEPHRLDRVTAKTRKGVNRKTPKRDAFKGWLPLNNRSARRGWRVLKGKKPQERRPMANIKRTSGRS